MKAVVISKSENECVVLKSNGEFLNIKNRNYFVGQELDLPSKKVSTLICSFAAAFAVCILSAFAIYYASITPTSYVYLDVNPSFRLDVNRFNKVIGIHPLNDQAESLSAELDTSSKSVDKYIERIISVCKIHGYSDNDVEINLVSKSTVLKDKILETSESIEDKSVIVSVYSVEEEENELAIKHSISPKRLRAIKEYSYHIGGDVKENTNLLKELSTDEIFEKVREYRHSKKDGNEAKNEESNQSTSQNQSDKEGKDSSRLSYISEKRLEAIKKYTKVFGGTLEDNANLLRGLSTKEIYKEISSHLNTNKKS